MMSYKVELLTMTSESKASLRCCCFKAEEFSEHKSHQLRLMVKAEEFSEHKSHQLRLMVTDVELLSMTQWEVISF